MAAQCPKQPTDLRLVVFAQQQRRVNEGESINPSNAEATLVKHNDAICF